MIKINLLPPEDRKKTRRIKLPTFSGGGPKALWMIAGLAVYAGMVIAVASLQSKSVGDLEAKIEKVKQESEALAPQLERIRKLTKEREEVDRRLGIIASLDRERYFRVELLNDISEKMPPNSWITAIKENGGTEIVIDGVTFSNYLIADLMTSLDKSDHFDLVSLSIAQEGKILEHKVIQFTLSSKITP
jgi:type IV pilus assembly protein PilN